MWVMFNKRVQLHRFGQRRELCQEKETLIASRERKSRARVASTLKQLLPERISDHKKGDSQADSKFLLELKKGGRRTTVGPSSNRGRGGQMRRA